jgi:glycosyltransferase involved in cell wall biosynthesis
MALIDETARIVVAGDGPDKGRAVARTAKMGLNGRVVFTGWVAHHHLSDLYRQARAVVVPSRWQEPFGLAGLEALDQARPVAAYDVGGVGEWLEDGRTGLTVPAGNTLALAAAVNVLLRQPGDAAEMGRTGRELVRTRFDRRSLMNRLVDLYRNVVNGDS